MSGPIETRSQTQVPFRPRPSSPLGNLVDSPSNSVDLPPTHQLPSLSSLANLTGGLDDFKTRHQRAHAKLRELQTAYLKLPQALREHAAVTPEHRSQCVEAFENDKEVSKTFTGTMLDAIESIIRDAGSAIRFKDVSRVEVEMSCAEEFMSQTEEKIERLELAVNAFTEMCE